MRFLPFLAWYFAELVVRIPTDSCAFNVMDRLEFAPIPKRNVIGRFFGPRSPNGMKVAGFLLDNINPRDCRFLRIARAERDDVHPIRIMVLHSHKTSEIDKEFSKQSFLGVRSISLSFDSKRSEDFVRQRNY